MLVLRLSRVGRKKYATYRLLAQDSRRAPAGKFIAQLGHYNPHSKKAEFKVDEVQKYLQSGAQPSGAVVRLLKEQKIKMPKWAEENLKIKKKASKKKAAESEETEKPAAAKAEETNETVETSVPDTKGDKTEEVAESSDKSPESEKKIQGSEASKNDKKD
jgi:small subunit ribosomal protein S16